MKAERDIERKIKQKEEEVDHIRKQLIQAETELRVWQESLRLIQRTTSNNGSGVVRAGSLVDRARNILIKEGKPLHVNEILKKMGRESSKKNKVSISGSLGGYVRQKYIFTRPAPNTFGLIEFGDEQEIEETVPESFGRDM